MMLVTFSLSILFFLVIGILSSKNKKKTVADYLTAGREVSPWLTALSAVASNNSGFMFIGLIGMTYSQGLSSLWIMFGWIMGDLIAWLTVVKRIRIKSASEKVNTVAAFMGIATKKKIITKVAAIISIIFLSLYAAAQLRAGTKALNSLMGWSGEWGILIGGIIVLAYSVAGGIRASIWTDAAQAVVMIISMLLMFAIIMPHIGGFQNLYDKLDAINPSLVTIMPTEFKLFSSSTGLAFALYILGWLMAGIGVVGQPHIIIRMMIIDSSRGLLKAGIIYFSWYFLFTFAAVIVGLCSRILLPVTTGFDVELALPNLAMNYLPPALVGVILAGLFAATMSTADSQVISCSASLSQDLLPSKKDSYKFAKFSTVLVTLFVMLLSYFADKSVFSLVAYAWAVLASGLGPTIIIQALNMRLNDITAVAMALTGVLTVFIWEKYIPNSNEVFSALPGILAGFLIYGLMRLFYAVTDDVPKMVS